MMKECHFANASIAIQVDPERRPATAAACLTQVRVSRVDDKEAFRAAFGHILAARDGQPYQIGKIKGSAVDRTAERSDYQITIEPALRLSDIDCIPQGLNLECPGEIGVSACLVQLPSQALICRAIACCHREQH
jgi:hypothetical protein